MIVVAILTTATLVLPAGCIISLAAAGGTLFAASAAATCSDESNSGAPAGPASADPDPNVAGGAEPPGAASSVPCPPPEAAFGGDRVVDPVTVPAPDAQTAVAVAAALTAVARGGRYVAEGNGPVDFDCSGLTAWAWRQARVSLADYSYTQRAQTRDIPQALVQPGDLVFWFGGTEHHVAIVTAVADGQITIAEAANPAAGIRLRQLGGEWDDAYLTGFGRVVRG